ncbi:triple tyrosine motif-containing protein [Zunongwangia sp. H14]|uniref:triple tyrosine motif-containing protein n=1 Tax=Zunongwangia sp. H14 TaxID=3240792 RepID=UPI0035646FFF
MRYFVFICLLVSQFILGQELPPVINYDPNIYEAGNQNWMISQGDNRNMYIANGMGLLEFTGEDWNLYPVPNKTIVRSVKVVGERIYTGAYMEVGYWKRDSLGTLQYRSLNPVFPRPLVDGEQFWDIEESNGYILFRSFSGIYLYDPGSEKIVLLPNPASKPVTNLFKEDGKIYFQLADEGLFTITNAKPVLAIPQQDIRSMEIMEVFRQEQGLLLINSQGGFSLWDKGGLRPVFPELSSVIKEAGILSAVQLSNGDLVLGTVGEGIYHTSASGEVLHHFEQGNVLLNNTSLSLFVDKEQNLWAGLDNGLSVINLDSSFAIFEDNKGDIGSVYCSFQNSEYLYLGTNQGLYYRTNNEENFKLIEGTNGQVWSLQEISGNLFCGHNTGTFLVKDTSAEKISDRLGTWLVKALPTKPGFYIQGHYNGISFLKEQADGSFRDLAMLADFPHSSKFIVPEDNGEIWISNEHKGVFKMRINDSLTAIASMKNYRISEEPAITSCIFKFDDSLYFSSKDRILKYNVLEDAFIENTRLGRLLNDTNRLTGRIVEDGTGKIWGFGENVLFNVEVADLSDNYRFNPIYISREFRNITLGYENISRLNHGDYLMGISNGYLKFNHVSEPNVIYDVRIDKIASSRLDERWEELNPNCETELHYRNNNVLFRFSTPVYKKFLAPVYSYRLLGLSPKWSHWEDVANASFKNLPYGDYTFEVKAKVGAGETEKSSYHFTVQRPWYLSYLALLGYFMVFLLVLYGIHLLSQRQHRKQVEENEKALRMRNLEAEQKIIKLENERLEQDMENKNRELAASTMSLIKKNEFLSDIKHRLQEAESSKVKSVIKTIDKDISEEDNWNFFQKAFSNADKDFFHKMKQKHPELTSNDLKLCAYLRLNLSSKEMAPLLNISVKSVEIKRYRLRKKMKLGRNDNLTDYILAV